MRTPFTKLHAVSPLAFGLGLSLFLFACSGERSTHDPGTLPSEVDTQDGNQNTGDLGTPIDYEEDGNGESPSDSDAHSGNTGDTSSESDGDGCDSAPYATYCPCSRNDQCQDGWCFPVDEPDVSARCTRTCVSECENGWECRGVATGGDPLFICTPPVDSLCDSCESDADCRVVGAKCIHYPDGNFCGAPCDASGEDCPGDFSCDALENELGQFVAYQCMPDNGSCICEEGTDFDSDPENCGQCRNKCNIPNSVPLCSSGECAFGGCLPGFSDLNENLVDGCEYECTFIDDYDEPQTGCNDRLCDRNCDGINGTESLAIFVADRTTNGIGTKADPMNNLQQAMAKAKLTGRPHVYVTVGTYRGQFNVVDGVSLYGGYSNDGLWVRDLGNYKSILDNSAGSQNIVTLAAANISTDTVIDGFTIQSGDNTLPGGSSYAIHVLNSGRKLVFRNLTAIGGNGGKGNNGEKGNKGSDGEKGSDGSDGAVNGGCKKEGKKGDGGSGGGNKCDTGSSAAGGKGGDAGCGNPDNANRPKPTAGSTSAGGAAGGQPSTNTAAAGRKGKAGAAGEAGADGQGGNATGKVVGNYWQGEPGANGDIGKNGIGGGGGAGGHGAVYRLLGVGWEGRWGGGGSGGGSGGCGGTAGRGGTAGGGSFGIFLQNASPVLENVKMGHKNGGSGGRGGDGGSGGSGANPGTPGVSTATNQKAQTGANGGTGGDGGRGGHGGGGAGGVAYAIYMSGTSDPQCIGVTFASTGTGGLGGSSSANSGKNGASGDKFPVLGSPSCR